MKFEVEVIVTTKLGEYKTVTHKCKTKRQLFSRLDKVLHDERVMQYKIKEVE